LVRHFLRDTYYTTREFSENARLFLVSTFLVWAGYSVHTVLFNLYLAEGGFGEEFVGRCLSLTGLGMGLAALPAGFLSDRLGRRLCLLLGSVGMGAASTLRAFTLDPALLLAACFAAGAAYALVAISASPFLSENSETHVRTHLFSAHFIVILVAGVCSTSLGGQVPDLLLAHAPRLAPDLLVAYRWTLAAGGVVTVLAAWPLLSVRELPPVEAAAGAAPAPAPAGAAGPMAKLALNFFLIGCGAGLVIPFFNLYFANRFGCTSGQIGGYYAASQVLTALAALAGPPLARRFGLLATMTWLQLASLPFLVTLGFESALPVAVGAFLARAVLMQTSSPLLNAFAMEVVPPALRARATAVNNAVWFLGWAGSASVAGWIMARYGYDYPYYMTAALYGAASIAFYRMFRRTPHGRARPDGVPGPRPTG
jgi:MFS family permease